MRLFLIGLFLMVATVANAKVEGITQGFSQDANGNIVVKVAYYMDGVNMETQYPKENGIYYQVFRLSFQNIDGMTAEQIGEYIDQNVKQHCESLIQRKANAVENAKLDLSSYVGRKVTVESTEMQISPVKAYIVGTAGKVSEKALTPPVVGKTLEEKIDELIAVKTVEAVK
jgi:hypothetical protein